jgi:hypothetical protein
MRWLVLVLVLLAASAQAQENESATYVVRVADGDVPMTAAVEPQGWNMVQTIRLQHDGNTTWTPYQPGGTLVRWSCDCGANVSEKDGTLTVGADVPAGPVELSVTHNFRQAGAFASPMEFPVALRTDAALFIDAVEGRTVSASIPLNGPLARTHGATHMYWVAGTSSEPLPASLWFSVHPATTAPVRVEGGGFDWLALAVGLIAGAFVWAVLVSRGMVQKRTRRQVAAPAAHAAYAGEPKEMLAGRKRVLMAGLKELELAKMAGEIDTASYDKVKAEFKKETVAVMRALEESQ